jgi:hypothetical protein
MECVQKLKTIGYELRLKENHIICTWGDSGQPDPQKVGPLLAELKANRREAIEYLQKETADLFLKSFKKALAELNRRYVPGTLDWVGDHCPHLCQGIERAEDELDSLWREGDPGLFGEALKRWQELHEQAMQAYAKPEFSDLVTLLQSGRSPSPLKISPAETVTDAETFLRSYLRDLAHPRLGYLAYKQLLAFRKATAKRLVNFLKEEEN